MGKPLDLIGQKFGRLTVVERTENESAGQSRWLCYCDCGNCTVVRGTKLVQGRTKSCGCLGKEVAMSNLEKGRLHTDGRTKTKLYRIWCDMRRRCGNPKDNAYSDYGGRGIIVCPEWNASFDAFRNWALSNGYAEHLTIDRIDNSNGYCPENCRWVDMQTQSRNKRNNVFLVYDGNGMILSDWAKQLKIPANTLYDRLKRGWSVERTLATPVQKKQSKQR